ncbi:MAG: hypothetical protein SFZ02_11595 [bacterium]|nr:hypothetical protein [bacterium]
MKTLGILLIILGLFMGISAQTDVSPPLDDQLNGIEMFISASRGLPIVTPTIRQFPTREEAVTFITTSYEADLSPEIAMREELFYRALGFVAPDFDMREFYSGFLSQQVAGYYDTETKHMNTILMSGGVLGDELPFLEQIIYAHEFTHALQDQHFDLSTLTQQTASNADQSLALTALIEGDATYMMQAFTFNLVQDNITNMGILLNDSISALGGATMPPNTPPIFIAEISFAYFEGMNFVGQVQVRGGWDAVNGVFENLPASSEHILHPQKYFDAELPIFVPAPDISETLSADWQQALTRTVGEFYLREYLKLHLRSRMAVDAAAGWNGDAITIYHQPTTDQVIWQWIIVWDTSDDTTEFVTAYQEFLETKFEMTADITADNEFCFASAIEAICVWVGENRTIIISAPDKDAID